MAKYRVKHFKSKILIQVVVICYALVMSASLLASDTSAYFSTQSSTSVSIPTADYWWDQSELVFTSKNTQNVKECAPHEISVEIKNIGEDMTGSTEFKVYFTEKGNPQNKHGKEVHEGNIKPLDNGEKTDLVYEAEEDGFYKFKAYQMEGFDDNYDERTEIWSEKVHLNCNAAKSEKEEDDKKKDDKEEKQKVEDKDTTEETEKDHDTKEEDESSDQDEKKDSDGEEETKSEEKQHKEEEEKDEDQDQSDEDNKDEQVKEGDNEGNDDKGQDDPEKPDEEDESEDGDK